VTCALTVATLLNSSSAISAFELPRPIATATSRSRYLSEFDISGVGWAHLATSVALWVAIPFVIGLVRIIRAEVS
jgi:ABC-2 type transport system permease protein